MGSGLCAARCGPHSGNGATGAVHDVFSAVLQVRQVQTHCDTCARTGFPTSSASLDLDAAGWHPFAPVENIAQVFCVARS